MAFLNLISVFITYRLKYSFSVMLIVSEDVKTCLTFLIPKGRDVTGFVVVEDLERNQSESGKDNIAHTYSLN